MLVIDRSSPAMGEQREHCEQQQDEHQDEGQRQDEWVQIWGGRSRLGGAGRAPQDAIPTIRACSLTTGREQRCRLRPGAPEASKAGLGHARPHRERVPRGAAQVTERALGAPVQDLHLGAGRMRILANQRAEKGVWGRDLTSQTPMKTSQFGKAHNP